MEARVENGRTPLHVVLDSLTVLDDVNKLARFLRRNCRVDVEATDRNGRTPQFYGFSVMIAVVLLYVLLLWASL